MSSKQDAITDARQEGSGILHVDSLTKRFGGLVAVDDLSFHLEEGEILGFIGPNGAGKSTTFNCLTGIYPPTEGTVIYRGEDITRLATHKVVKKGIARTFQDFRSIETRSVVENVRLALVPDRFFTTSGLLGGSRQEALALCDRVGLNEKAHKAPDELPHIDILRLELARALASEPDVLLVDEPFAGLSRAEVEEISQLLLEFRDTGISLIVIDHNMRGLLDLIDRAVVIQFGSKIAEGAPEQIKEDETVQEAYLGSDIQ